MEGIKPSKEYPLHAMIYRYKPEMKGVVHTHSFYSVLWSCLEHEKKTDVIPAYTPYLKMKVGTVGIILMQSREARSFLAIWKNG